MPSSAPWNPRLKAPHPRSWPADPGRGRRSPSPIGEVPRAAHSRTRLRPLPVLDRLAAIDVDAVNVFHRRLGRHTVAAAHQRGILAFAWGARRRISIERAIRRGADGIFADDVEALVAAVHAAHPSQDSGWRAS